MRNKSRSLEFISAGKREVVGLKSRSWKRKEERGTYPSALWGKKGTEGMEEEAKTNSENQLPIY